MSVLIINVFPRACKCHGNVLIVTLYNMTKKKKKKIMKFVKRNLNGKQ